MEIRCRCSACQAKFKVDAKYAGKKARCPKCQQIVSVPTEDLEASTTSLPSLGTAQGMSSSTVVPPKPAPAAAQPAAPPPASVAVPAPQPKAESAPATEANSATPSASDSFAGFQLQASRKPGAGKISVGSSATSEAAGKRGKKSSALPLAVGGGLLALVMLVGGGAAIWALAQPVTARSGSGTAGNATTGSGTTLVLDWPDAERLQASLSIDGRREIHAKTGELKFALAPGRHKVIIQRRGFEPFESEVTLARGESQRLAPQWKVVATTVASATPAGNATTTQPAPAVGSGGSFPIGTAVAPVEVRGFEGWLQSLEQAKQQAAAEHKDILVVFGISDVHPRTKQLSQLLHRSDMQAATAGLVKVVIDLPLTPTAQESVQDLALNEQLREEFCVDNFPALVLTDERGRGYFFQEQWPEGVQSIAAKLGQWQQQKAERDQLIEASGRGTPDEQLAAAATAVKWLQEHIVYQFFRTELDRWLSLAQQADPNNDQSLLETFFEPQWMLQLEFVNAKDSVAVGRLVGQLDPWAVRKFKDHDRGAKLHLYAAKLLQEVKDQSRFQAHLEHAARYQPKDAKLAEASKQLRMMLENKDILGNGTGYLISAAGYVLTNHHVIEGAGGIAVRVPGTTTNVPAQLIAQDDKRDIALLKVALPNADKYRPLALSPDGVRRGSEVAAFGYPLLTSLGAGLKFTAGPVSSLPDDTNDQMYLLDVTVNPGNSGGPLCDRRGNVVGMITAMTSNSALANSYGLAIPAADLIKFLDKHLPPGTPRATPVAGDANLGWDQVDEKVSSGVLMILQKR